MSENPVKYNKKKPKLSKTAQRKKFIRDTFLRALSFYPVRMVFAIQYEQEEENPNGGEMSVGIVPNNNDIALYVYKSAFSKSEKRLLETIAHEVGHLFVKELDNLVTQTYVSEEEHHKIKEKTATHIGVLLEELRKKK